MSEDLDMTGGRQQVATLAHEQSGDGVRAAATDNGAGAASRDSTAASGPTKMAEQQAQIKSNDPAKATLKLVENGSLPAIELVHTADQPAPTGDVVAADKPLTPEQKYFTDLYQHRLQDANILAHITPMPKPEPGESDQDLAKRFQKIVEDRAQAIASEMGRRDAQGQNWVQAPRYGAATASAFKDYVEWVEQREVPAQILSLQSQGLPMPLGSPIEVPLENGQRISLDRFAAGIAEGKAPHFLQVDTAAAPTLVAAQKIENALDWSNRAMDLLDQSSVQHFDDRLADSINKLGLPKGWLYQAGEDKDAWRAAAGQMIDLVTTVGRMANLIDKMHLPIDLPAAATVKTGAAGSKIALDLPQNLQLNDPATLLKVQQLKQWQQDVSPRLADVRQQLANVAKNPNLAIAWGDTVLPKVKNQDGREVTAKVALDKDGKLLSVVDPSQALPAGQKAAKANLLEQRFTAATDNRTGEIVVHQNVQAQEVPRWSYMNVVRTNVGKPADLGGSETSPGSAPDSSPTGSPSQERRFQPDDLVAVSRGSGTEFMLARDLESFERTQSFLHYGENTLMGVMDVAMLATGTVEIGAALKGARLLAAGAQAAGLVAGRDVAVAGAKGVWDTGLALGGLSSNAEMQSSSWGREFATARNAAFMGTIFYGAAAARIPAMRFSSKLTEAHPAPVTGENPAPAVQKAAARDTVVSDTAAGDATARPALPEPVRTADGLVVSTTDGAGTARHFEYTRNAQGEAAVSKITIGEGAGQLTLERSATAQSDWTVRRAGGEATKLEADIKVNADGSYTVSHVTDGRAAWYGKAFYSETPDEPLLREVTYNRDGTVTTRGLAADFKPPEGSTYRKDARFGEYWTTPQGKQYWIDGENRLWQEKSSGIWQSNDGVWTENKEYVKKARTAAIELDAPLEWTKVIDGKPVNIKSQAGDFKIGEKDGTFYVVERSVFDRTYEKAPGVEGEYIKKPIRARQLTEDLDVENRWGNISAKKGDYVVTGLDGETYPVKKDTFERLYQRSTTDSEAPQSFSLPKPTGAPVHRADGSTAIPYDGGEVIWSPNSDSVTITDKAAGTSNTFSGSDIFSAGTRFYFANGAEERITPSGLRFIHTPDMQKNRFVGEDGAILQDVPRAESAPVLGGSSPASSSRYGNTATRDSLPYFSAAQLPRFVSSGKDGEAAWHVQDRDFSVKIYGTEWTEPDGMKYMIDSRSRVWQEKDGQWVNNNGALKIDEQGQRWSWKDGSADWLDSSGRMWHRTVAMPAGEWLTEDGASYHEGSWKYTPRTRDDAHDPRVLIGLAELSLVPAATAAQSGAAMAQEPAAEQIKGGSGAEAALPPVGIGPLGQTVEQVAGKLMLASTYPMLAQQVEGLSLQAKDIVGMQLQSMGYQLSQMWSPSNPYAVARAVQDYDAIKRPAAPDPAPAAQHPAPAAQVPPLNNAGLPKDDLAKVPGVIQEYEQLLTENLPTGGAGKATLEEIRQPLQKLAHALSAQGTPQERDLLKGELAANVAFKPWEIEELEKANGGKLSSQQIDDLMDPAKRAKFPNPTVGQWAQNFADARDANLVTTSELALLYLARQMDGAGPLGVATAELDVMPHYAGSDALGARLLPDRKVDVHLNQTVLAGDLQRRLATKGGDGRGVAIGDVLIKNGFITPQQYGGILQNVLKNPDASAADKMHALSDANGPRMAALIGGLLLQGRKDGLDKDLTAAQRAARLAGDFGQTAADFEKTLARLSVDDGDGDVRAMSAAMLYSLKRFADNPYDGARLIDRLSALRQSDIDNNKGSFAGDAAQMLSSELTSSAPAAVQQRLDAAEAYALLAEKAQLEAAGQMRGQISHSLAAALSNADLGLSDKVAAALVPDRLHQLSLDQADFAESIRRQLVDKIQLPATYNVTAGQDLVGLMGKMPAVLDGASSQTRDQFYDNALKVLQDAPPAYAGLRRAALESIGALGKPAAIPMLEGLAAADHDPAVRIAALKALETMRDPGLAKLVSERVGAQATETTSDRSPVQSEGEPTVLSYLQDLQYRLGAGSPSSTNHAEAGAELMRFQSSIAQRYPDLSTFDAGAQKDWLEHNFPLLVRDNFNKQVISASAGKTDWFGAPTNEGGEATEAQRQEQFDRLVDLSQSNSSSAAQARQVLYSMITGGGGTIGPAGDIPIGLYAPPDPSGFGNLQEAYFNEKGRDWAAEAAAALAKTAGHGNGYRDLTARLVGMALAAGVKGSAREQLLGAWDRLGSPANGAGTIPESLYKYVRNMGT